MKSQLLIGIPGVALTLLLAGAAQGQANDLVCTQCVNTSDVANDAIGSAKLRADSVTSEKIGAGEIKTGDINAGAVTSEKIGAGEVKTSDIADLAISNSKLKAGSVTEAKLDPAVQAKLTAPQLVFAGATSVVITLDGGGCENIGEVTITVPGPGNVKVDTQAPVYMFGHLAGVTYDSMRLYLEGISPPDDLGPCEYVSTEPGYLPKQWLVMGEDTTPNQMQVLPLTRIFKVASAGTYTFYLNGERIAGVNGVFQVAEATLQALYFPDL